MATMTVILAGGVGSRLAPLTDVCTKPAVEFGAKYRVIDFMMSNCLNSRMKHILLLTQYRSHELNKHIADNYPSDAMHGFFVHTVPAQQIHGETWYRGTADAVYQNLSIIESEGDFDTIAILSGDHVLAMDFGQMCQYHKKKKSHFTVCVMPVPTAEAHRFGVLEIDRDWRIVGFEEKPAQPKEIPGQPGMSLVSMGNYFARYHELAEWLTRDAEEDSAHDFGKNIIPALVAGGVPVYAYNFLDNQIKGQNEHYWRDVGTIGSLHEANLDLVAMKPELNLYNPHWRIRSAQDNLPPAKFIETTNGSSVRFSVVSGGCIIQDSRLYRSVLGREVRTYGSTLIECVLFSGVTIGHGSSIRRAIIDKDVQVPPGTMIGHDHEADRARGLTVDESGIVVVPRAFKFG